MAFKVEQMIPAQPGWRAVCVDYAHEVVTYPVVAWASGTIDEESVVDKDVWGIGSPIVVNEEEGFLEAVAQWAPGYLFKVLGPHQDDPTPSEIREWLKATRKPGPTREEYFASLSANGADNDQAKSA